MGLFGPSRPKRVTAQEFKRIKSALYRKLDQKEWADVEQLFNGDLNEEGRYAGIDRAEAQRGLAWLRENKKKHHLEDGDIDLLEAELEKHLKD